MLNNLLIALAAIALALSQAACGTAEDAEKAAAALEKAQDTEEVAKDDPVTKAKEEKPTVEAKEGSQAQSVTVIVQAPGQPVQSAPEPSLKTLALPEPEALADPLMQVVVVYAQGAKVHNQLSWYWEQDFVVKQEILTLRKSLWDYSVAVGNMGCTPVEVNGITYCDTRLFSTAALSEFDLCDDYIGTYKGIRGVVTSCFKPVIAIDPLLRVTRH